jgi:hypothetical protein
MKITAFWGMAPMDVIHASETSTSTILHITMPQTAIIFILVPVRTKISFDSVIFVFQVSSHHRYQHDFILKRAVYTIKYSCKLLEKQ